MIIKHAKVIGIAACLLVASLANAQVEYAWKVIATHPSAQSITAYQGETICLKPALYSYNNLVTNITSATLYWQTNGMDTAWWSKPAEINDGQITATFAPTNDFGAAAYTFFIRASSGSGASYRANGTLRMLDSPGHSPAAAVDPAAYGTLAQDIAPWVLAVLPAYDPLGAALAVSNTLAGVIGANSAAVTVVAEALQNISNSLAQADAVMAAGLSILQTARVDKVWSSDGTRWLDAAMQVQALQIVTNETPFYVVADPALGWNNVGDKYIYTHETVQFVPEIPFEAYETLTTNIYYHLNGDTNNLPPLLWETYYRRSPSLGQNEWSFQFSSWDLMFEDNANNDWYCSGTATEDILMMQPCEFDYYMILNRGVDTTIVVQTNVITQAVTTNGTIIITGSAADSSGSVTQLTARAGENFLTMPFYGRGEAQAAISAIPQFPTNYVGGILLPDHATNITYTLIITNGLLTTWRVLP